MQKQSFNTNWHFHLGNPRENPWDSQQASAWRMIDLPHDWSIELPRGPEEKSTTSGGFFQMGRGWYRKTFTPPAEWQGKRVSIEFEGVYMNAEVWLNGRFLGRHPYGYTTFSYDLTRYLQEGTENILRISVDNSHLMNSRWYSGSGIYRPVWLMVAEPVHVAQNGVYVTTPKVSKNKAAVSIRTAVENTSSETAAVVVRSRILGPEGALVGGAESQVGLPAGSVQVAAQEIQVTNPQLWSVDTPSLYRLETEILLGGKVIDTAATTFGIRSVEFSAEKGFLLNGVPTKLKGGCVHHDNGILGAASFARAEERKVELHKASGYNAIRCAHNPPAPAFLEACDRLGMLVIDEAFDCWREGKNPGDYHVAFDDWWQRDIQSMVLRDRNHPSIILWSIGNEVMERDRQPEGAEIAHMLAAEVHRLDPTRPVTSAICGNWTNDRKWDDTAPTFAELGVGGYNYQWKEYQSDHEKYPQRMMTGTESFPLEAFDNWMQVLDNPYVLGDFVWTSLDYLGESGIGRVHFEEKPAFLGEYPWHQANCGDLDLCGFKRPQSFYRDMLWQVGEPLYLVVHTPLPEGKTPTISRWGWPDVWPTWNWPGCEGKPLKVEVYSRCDEVELMLNGRSQGKQKTGKTERFAASFDVSYEAGELKVIGYNAGKKAAEHLLKTAGKGKRIRLSADRAEIGAGEGSLAYITVEVLDADGLVDPLAENPIYFTTQGSGKILAVGSGNPVSEEAYRGNTRKAFHGRCLVAVQPDGSPGEITLFAQADGLEGAEVKIKTR